MIVNEKALVSAMKDSYKGGGYSVAFGSGQVFISGHSWSVWCAEDELPRKVLGMIAEHLGKIPKAGQAYRICKAMGIQSQLFDEMVGGEQEIADKVHCGSRCTVTGLTINGMDVWQNENGSILLAHPDKEEMWAPASLCMASDKWMGIWDENSAVYITLEEVPYTIGAKLAYLEKFRWTV